MIMQPPTTSFIKVLGCTVSLLRSFVYKPGPMKVVGPGPALPIGPGLSSKPEETSPDFYKVSLSIREKGQRRTRLTLRTTYRGQWQGVGPEIERWIIEELRGAPAASGR